MAQLNCPCFFSQVFDFFKERIELQYPLFKGEEDPMEKTREAHEAFMKSRGEMVLGRGDMLKEVQGYFDH